MSRVDAKAIRSALAAKAKTRAAAAKKGATAVAAMDGESPEDMGYEQIEDAEDGSSRWRDPETGIIYDGDGNVVDADDEGDTEEMSGGAPKPGAKAAAPAPRKAATGAAGERNRIASIQRAEGASDAANLAEALAFDTTLSADEAGALIAAAAADVRSAVEAVAARTADAEPAAGAADRNAFRAAMHASKGPVISPARAAPATGDEDPELAAALTMAKGHAGKLAARPSSGAQ